MGLYTRKKNDFDSENDGKTFNFTDFFTAPPADNGNEDDLLDRYASQGKKEEEKQRTNMDLVNPGRKEQKPNGDDKKEG